MTGLAIPAEHGELRRLGPWLKAHAVDLDPEFIGRIELCVHELATNVIDHAGALGLWLDLVARPECLEVEMHDDGAPLTAPRPDELEPHPRVRGYGTLIAEQLASVIGYERRGAINVWTVRFDLT